MTGTAGPTSSTGQAAPATPARLAATVPGPAAPAVGFGSLDALYETDVQTPGSGRTPVPAPGGHGEGGGSGDDSERPARQQDTESEEAHRATSPHRAPGPLGADFEAIVATGAFG